ncbi:MAG: class I SAM-dependent methyltransferase [Elusimicrobiota bacterium]|nr:class I SAM-dependent methyltransferase [Endomicrobiia bacterium]MDW8165362.1 class I SAM-dependent methyltransferase [Elusimicrobiota bacterium]
MNKIFLEWPIVVHKKFKNETLQKITSKFSIIKKILDRLPQKVLEKIYKEDYTVTERIFERGFLFMNLYDVSVGSKILDVGCCWSSISLELSCLGYKVWGIDISEYPFYHPNFTFVKGSICKTEFEDNFFDVIIAISTIEHIGLGHYGDSVFEDDYQAVSEIKRILKPNGKFILTLPFGKNMKTQLFRVYDKEALNKLISSFEIVKLQYFLNYNDKYWTLVTEEEVISCGVNERGRNTGNVCIVLKNLK